MILDDLIRTAPALGKGATALDAAIPSGEIAKPLLGQAAVEVAEMWRDRVRLYRYERQLSCLKKAVKIAEYARLRRLECRSRCLSPAGGRIL
jgi:hypothetical protein